MRDAWSGKPGAATVIQIQDAHCNYAAQKKIADIIGYLNDNYGVGLINLEGGAKEYDLTVFTDIGDKAVREKTADYFVREGLVNGAEYFAINNPEKAVLWGIEDPRLYVENLKVYRNSLQHKEEIEGSLKSISYALTNLKIKMYSEELLEFDTKYSQFKADNIGLKEYLAYLFGKAKEKSIDIKAFENISLLSRAQAEESAINFNKANNERDALIDMLQKKLSKNAMEGLVAKTVEFKAENISQKEFYDYLVKKAGEFRIDIRELPDLSKYIGYISLYDAMDKTKFIDESDALETKIKDAMFENDGQRDLARLSKNLTLMKNIFNISLTRDDYRYYKSHEGDFAISNYERFIADFAPKYNFKMVVYPGVGKLDRYREDISKFYEYSFRRDDAFLKNMRITNGKPGATILITGGFHTDNLCDMFRKEGISYISILPNFVNDSGYESPYFTLLSGGERGMVEKLYTIISSAMLPIPERLIGSKEIRKALREVLNEDEVTALKAAVFVQSRIEAGKRVKILVPGAPDLLLGEVGEVEEMTVDDLVERVKSGIVEIENYQKAIAAGKYQKGAIVDPTKLPPVIPPSAVPTPAVATPDEMRKDLLGRFEAVKLSAKKGDWVVKFDGPRIGLTNQELGPTATDWIVAEIIKNTITDFAFNYKNEINGINIIPAKIGGRGSEEFAFCLPAALKESDILIIMDDLMQKLKEKCGQYIVIALNKKLDPSQIEKLESAGAKFLYSASTEGQVNVRAKFIIDKAKESDIVNLLGPNAQVTSEDLGVPYPVSAAIRLKGSGKEYFDQANHEADILQGEGKDIKFDSGGKLVIFESTALVKEEKKAPMKLSIAENIALSIKDDALVKAEELKLTPYAVEEIYGAYHRDSLGRLLSDLHTTPVDKRRAGTYLARGPPNEFYVIEVKDDLSLELMKFDTLFFTSNPGMEAQFEEILKSGRDYFSTKDDARKMFGFKAINTVFGYDGGNFVISAIRYALQNVFGNEGNRDASLEEKTRLAAEELNALFNNSGFGCFIMASNITEEDASDTTGYKDFVDSADTKVSNLIRAGDILIRDNIPTGNVISNYVVKRYSDYKSLNAAISENLDNARYYQMINAEKEKKSVYEDYAAKAHDLHEMVSHISSDAATKPILPSEGYGSEAIAAISAPERRMLTNMLVRRNWYYAKFSSADRDLFNSDILGGLKRGVQELIKDLVVENLRKKGIVIDKSAIEKIYMFGSWCYAIKRHPSDIDIAVVVKDIDENVLVENISIDNPTQWFLNKDRIVEKCDIKILSVSAIRSTAPKSDGQLIEEANLWGHGVLISGMDPIRGPPLLKTPSQKTLLKAAKDFLLAAELYAMAINNKDETMKTFNLDKLERRWREALNIIYYLMANYHLIENDNQAIRKLLSLEPNVQKAIETKDMSKILTELMNFRQALDAQYALWNVAPFENDTYSTTVTVAKGAVSIAQHTDRGGIIESTMRTLSAGDSGTIIARVGPGNIPGIQSPDRVTDTCDPGIYATRVDVLPEKGAVSVVSLRTFEKDGTFAKGEVFVGPDQSASVMGRIIQPASGSYLAELAAKAALESISEPGPAPAAPEQAAAPVADIEALKKIIEDMPELKTGPIAELMRSVETNSASQDEVKSVLAALRYNAGIRENATLVLRGLGKDGKKFILVPISEKLCPLNAVSLKGQLHKTWTAVRNELKSSSKYDLDNIALVFYDGTLEDADKKLSGLVTDGAKQTNTVVYIDAMTNEDIDTIKGEINKAAEAGRPAEGAAGIYQNIMKRAYTIKDTADAQGGYLSITGHVVFALGALELVNTVQGAEDPAYFAQVMALMQRISPSAENYATDRGRFLDDLKRGDIILRLPPISKIDIDRNMETYFATEAAASSSL
ncbi:MAG: hypothetical protein V1682_05815 [Candidatus Omnitrophota bacterium]